MKLSLMHSKSITTFSPLPHYLELEEKRKIFQSDQSAYVAESNQCKTYRVNIRDMTKHIMMEKLK